MDRYDVWYRWFGGFATRREALEQMAHSEREHPTWHFRVRRAYAGGTWNVMMLENHKGKYFWRP